MKTTNAFLGTKTTNRVPELVCSDCPHCTCIDHEGYGKCARKENAVIKAIDPGCEWFLNSIDKPCWKDSFGNLYTLDSRAGKFIPINCSGTELSLNYIERLQKV